ncbi:hypothetical protein NF556_00125 [Ornithinimicrobium faecis]|uniref:Uncharacterized protein n=1 Tax=Ornithinimicrobium faecis TaxID=2934158 RepID=A0ABY4YTP3_9MICO|nr:hypothetical protein [Ornithinimicrobium sp. HY1793]USQ80108.1 hypothetical protein NF556_00125 [Ornithinimicrobium sp. HY1793]
MAQKETSANKKAVEPTAITDPVSHSISTLADGNALGALSKLVEATLETVQIHQAESTKRERLRTYRETEVERIKASERVLRDYFDRVFDERRETHERLFANLDLALQAGDVTAMQTVVGGIVEVARTSPLASIGNLGELRRAMDDPNAVFEL